MASLEGLSRSPTSQANLHLPESLNTRLTNAVTHLAKKDQARNDGYQARNFTTTDNPGGVSKAQNMRLPVEKLSLLNTDVGDRLPIATGDMQSPYQDAVSHRKPLPILRRAVRKGSPPRNKFEKKRSPRNTSSVERAEEAKKGTSVAEAGYMKMRIKSSKAFPLDDVGAIEELIHKVRKLKDGERQEPVDGADYDDLQIQQ